jgi:hypothetical protein
MFAENDFQLKSSLPLIELSLRAQISTVTGHSPYETVFGRPMCLPIIADDPVNQINFTGDQTDYFNLISRRLAEIHKEVKENLDEAKIRDARQFNKRNNAKDAHLSWKIGQQVLITDRNVKKNSDRIITRPRYHGSFYISDIIQNPGFGPSYRLVRVSDGKALKNLVSASRLRLYTADQRADFYEKYPALTKSQAESCLPKVEAMNENEETETGTASQSNNDDKNASDQDLLTVPGFEKAIKILKQRQRNKKPEYLVLFANKEKAWSDAVSPALLKMFRLWQEQQRKRRRKKRTKSY